MRTDPAVRIVDDRRKPPRLLVLTSTFPRRQNDVVPNFVLQLCRQLQADFEVHVLAPHAPGAATREYFSGLHIRRFRYFWPSLQRLAYGAGILGNIRQQPARCLLVPFFVFAQLGAAICCLRRREIDIIHAHWLIPQGLIAAVAGRLAFRRVKLLCTAHGSDVFALRGPVFRHLQRWLGARADAVSVVSAAVAESLAAAGVQKRKIRTIPMGVDLEKTFTPSGGKRENRTILYLGRLVEQKGVLDLIVALATVRQRFPDAALWIVGDGSERPRLEAKAAELGLQRTVRFFGAVPHCKTPEFFQRATAVALPSRRAEGFGLVLVEAMGCECPVVASDLPGVRDIVEPGTTGLLHDAGDPSSLAAQLTTLLADPELALRLARQARRRAVERFDWHIIGSRYRELLQELLENRSPHERLSPPH